MTKTLAKWLALALCAALTLSGCGLISVDKSSSNSAAQGSAASPTAVANSAGAADAQVVAEYDGGKITYDEALKEYQMWKSSYEAYGYQFSGDDDIKQLKQQVLDSLVQEKIVGAKAKSMGLTELTDADKKSIEDQANQEYEDAISYYSDYLQGDTDQETRQNAIDYLNSIGYTLDSIKEYDAETAWQDELKAQITKDVAVTDDQVKAAYDTAVKNDQQSFTEDNYNFENAATYGDTVTWVPEGYRAVKHILLTLSDDDSSKLSDLESQIEDVNVRISELENPGATDTPEEGDDSSGADASVTTAPDASATTAPDASVFADASATAAPDAAVSADASATAAPDAAVSDAVVTAAPDAAVSADASATAAPDAAVSADEASGNQDFSDDTDFSEDDSANAADNSEAASEDAAALENLTLPELQQKLTDLEAQLDALKSSLLTKMQPKVDEIQQKIASGEDFDKLIEQYGQDDGMKTEPTKTNGYYVSQDSQMWDDEFTTAAMALAKVGDVSGPVLSQSGVHIIKYIGDVTPGAVPLEKVKDEIKTQTLDQAKSDLYDQTVQGWVTEAHAKTYVDNLVDPAPSGAAAQQPEASPSASN